MPLVPYREKDQIRLLSVPAGSSAEEQDEYRAEEQRRREIVQKRAYYAGEQYDDENREAAQKCQVDPEDLPEHERKHAYSTHIGECVDFIADQLTEGFQVIPASAAVDDEVEAMVASTDALTSGEEDDDGIAIRDLVVDALQAGDVAYETRYDPVDDTVFVEFWESEHVQFITGGNRNQVEKVIRDEMVWVDDEFGERKQVRERVEYEVVSNAADSQECRRRVYYDEEEDPRDTSWLGVPFIPWGLLRGTRGGLRVFRGASLISSKVMSAADRYDAVEQQGWLIARYNSHGNLVVVGDGAALKVEESGGVHKDVADVLTFPGGTGWGSLTLPTDPAMIEHQRKVLADAMYAAFGLTRVEPDTIGGLGGISGYALEILNRKSDGTFRRVAQQVRKDFRHLVNLMLDVLAYRRDDGNDADGTSDLSLIDPLLVFPERAMEIRMASGYIVDDVAIRDDYTSGLISRREALRKRGYTTDQIDTVVGEITDEGQPATEAAAPATPPVSVEDELQQIGAGAGTFRTAGREG